MAILTVGNALLVVAAYLSWSVISQVVYYRFFHPLSKFPGNFWASVTRLWIAWHNIQEDECETYQKLHEQYGKPMVLLEREEQTEYLTNS